MYYILGNSKQYLFNYCSSKSMGWVSALHKDELLALVYLKQMQRGPFEKIKRIIVSEIRKRIIGNHRTEGWFGFYSFCGSLELSPAVFLPLLAQLPPRVSCLLVKEKQPAANQVEKE